jgi:hypothetical protein
MWVVDIARDRHKQTHAVLDERERERELQKLLLKLKLKLIYDDCQSASLSWCQALIWDP